MTRLAPAVIGDIGDVRTIMLDGVQDLSEATAVVAHVWREHAPNTRVALAASIVDPVERTISVNLGTANGWLATQATKADWLIEYQVSFGSSPKLTWPGLEPDVLPVRAQGDPA